ncbi:DNA cross-link repair 1A protein [Periophthalmus magnuspinnatus]|uniref:DNA cross-link repair 1A protein n=1 Tax=Periophthalmus magnuspinnatus TaxID=409849 RepID=UPI00145A3F1D|nr:DNA cross-link repair 1A protein [Periophthalmus magnuspinnatus]
MSLNDDSENNIWDYKPLKKKKKQESPLVPKTVSKRRCTTRGANQGHTSSSALSPLNTINVTTRSTVQSEPVPVLIKEENKTRDTSKAQVNISNHETTLNCNINGEEGESAGDYCPVCQMPFSILVVQSQRWHVVECLDFCRKSCKECPDGLLCSSSFPNHYRNFNHTLLAQSRASGDLVLPQTTARDTGIGPTITEHSGPVNNHVDEVDNSALKTSQDNFSTHSLASSAIINNHTNSPRIPNSLLLLRSPAPQDLKKKKGWSSPKVPKSPKVSSGQDTKAETPVKKVCHIQACSSILKSVPSPLEVDDAISYSPLSELPVEIETNHAGPRKTLFDIDPGGRENKDSVVPFSDSEDDNLFAELLDNLDNEETTVSCSPNTQVVSFTSLQQSNQETLNNATYKREKEKPRPFTNVGSSENSIQSPQSIVLERLRDTILKTEKTFCESVRTQSDKTNSEMPLYEKMTPQKTQSKGAQPGSLKQTDIGVFFGLKPLKDKDSKNPAQESQPVLTEEKKKGVKPQKKSRQRVGEATTSAGSSQSTVATVGNGTEGETRRASGKGWRKRTNAATGDGKYPCCPFYKKIPGTKFVVDAFRYGPVEGISTYFLTHFHSDHYDGLHKNSTFPIYCNKITGNLVKSKLRVPEQYVHILPMNTEVTVEGVKVTLLDANHCPGAAMLLFFLPDGQTVLHTGDFRADPSMETYPELRSCRVQTLYLDTTYCSPEYTFPKQQEVINYAANTAFELVTLNPRTLVVCGSYSVGKEKVFLALADVLGSKVCLSRDKFNTMCCLESEEIKQRITTDWKSAQVHVLPMMQLSFKKLQDHLARFSTKYDKLVAFKPTGWTFSQQVESVEDIEPHVSGNISIYGIPYSEHSSFLELKHFVQWLRPLKIIPTVNNGRWETRKAMERCFSEWMNEMCMAKL